MNFKPRKALIWSKKEEKLVNWDINMVEEKDEGGNKHTVIIASFHDEFHKFSPNATDEELTRFINDINKNK